MTTLVLRRAAEEHSQGLGEYEPVILISAQVVHMWMMNLDAPLEVVQNLPEIATAIADAANDDPLFAGRLGAYQTAALLVSLAHTQSRFHPTAVGEGYGLFQIRVPQGEPADVFLLPKTAAYCAVEILRQAIETSSHASGEHALLSALAWYEEPSAKTRARLTTARHLLAA